MNADADLTTSAKLRGQMPAFALVALASAATWRASLTLLPPIPEAGGITGRLAFALQCVGAATLFTLLAMVEAIAHERLVTPAFDPLAGRESRRLLVNARVLQSTLEQFVLFAAGLLLLAIHCDTGAALRGVAAATVVWVGTRHVFWIGYHFGAEYRVAGLVGQAQSMIVLLYGVAASAHHVAGAGGAAAVVVAFALLELAISLPLRRASA